MLWSILQIYIHSVLIEMAASLFTSLSWRGSPKTTWKDSVTGDQSIPSNLHKGHSWKHHNRREFTCNHNAKQFDISVTDDCFRDQSTRVNTIQEISDRIHWTDPEKTWVSHSNFRNFLNGVDPLGFGTEFNFWWTQQTLGNLHSQGFSQVFAEQTGRWG